MSNVLSDDKRQQIIALGRLGWSLRRIEQATGVRRETASAYLKAAGIKVRGPGRAAKPAIEVFTDSEAEKPAIPPENKAQLSKPAIEVFTDSEAKKPVIPPENKAQLSKPAIEVFTDSGLTKPVSHPAVSTSKALTLSQCEPYRELIEGGLQRGRNAMAIWQDLVTEYGYAHS